MKLWLGRLIYDFVARYLVHLDARNYHDLIGQVMLERWGKK